MSRFLVSNLNGLEEYVPGEQPRNKSYIKLNTNESPYPPSQGVINAIQKRQIEDLYLYSDPQCKELCDEFIKLYNINSENVVFSNGSDEVLSFCFKAFFSDKSSVAFPDITYGFYRVFGDLYQSDYQEIPLDNSLKINVNDYTGINKGIIIANPNAPTGILLLESEIERIIASNPENVVIIDEAYIDFGGKSVYKLCEKYDNLLVVGTFSKSRSLAGARLGFAIGCKELISDLQQIRNSINPYNLNRLTQIAGKSALLDNQYYLNNCKKIISCREYTKVQLEKRGFSVLPSFANFVFAKHRELGGEMLYLSLKQKGVLVRHFNNSRICDYLRITIGTKEQMNMLLGAIDEIINERG